MIDPSREPYEDPYVEEPDGIGMRWAKFISLIIALTVLGGVIGGGYTYWKMFQGGLGAGDRLQRHAAESAVKNDSFENFKTRVLVGSATGALFGIVYVVRCIVKKQDP